MNHQSTTAQQFQTTLLDQRTKLALSTVMSLSLTAVNALEFLGAVLVVPHLPSQPYTNENNVY